MAGRRTSGCSAGCWTGCTRPPGARSGCGSSAPDRAGRCPRDRPLLVLCRHAGPGDSLLLVRTLVTVAALRPRIVLKDALQLDPTSTCCSTGCRTASSPRGPGVAEDVEAGDRLAGAGRRPGRRGGDLPRGRQLHRDAGGPGPSSGSAGWDTRTRRRRPSGCGTCWRRDRAARWPRMAAAPDRGRRAGRARGPGGPVHARRPVAGPADGRRGRGALVARAVGGAAPLAGHRRAGRLALRLVGPAGRLDRRAAGRRRPRPRDGRRRGSDVAAEGVAGAWVAGLVPGGEPPLPLLGRAVRPRLRVDPAL